MRSRGLSRPAPLAHAGPALRALCLCTDGLAVKLLAAVREGDAAGVRALLTDAATGAVAWDRPCRYGTALHIAAYHGQTDIVRMLAAAGADVNARNDQGGPRE